MKRDRLRMMIFLALCCDLGLFSKRLVSPVANIITDALHVPGGIATSFSLMFLVIAAAIVRWPFCGTVMGAVQSVLALSFGMVGSMGLLSPVGYIVPGMLIDVFMAAGDKLSLPLEDRLTLANSAAAAVASLTANLIVFRLQGVVLALYVCIALCSGAGCGLLGGRIARRLMPVVSMGKRRCK